MMKRLLVAMCALMMVFEQNAIETDYFNRSNPYGGIMSFFQQRPELLSKFLSARDRVIPIGGSSLCAGAIMYVSMRGGSCNNPLNWYQGISNAVIPSAALYSILYALCKLDTIEKEVKLNGVRIENAEQNLGSKIDEHAREQKENLQKISDELLSKINASDVNNQQRHKLLLAKVEELAQMFATSVEEAKEKNTLTQQELKKIVDNQKVLQIFMSQLPEDIKTHAEQQLTTMLTQNKEWLDDIKKDMDNVKNQVAGVSSNVVSVRQQVQDLQTGQKEAEKQAQQRDARTQSQIQNLAHTTQQGFSQQYQQNQSVYGNPDDLREMFRDQPDLLAVIDGCVQENQLLPVGYIQERIVLARELDENFVPKAHALKTMITTGMKQYSPEGQRKILQEILAGQKAILNAVDEVARPGVPVIAMQQPDKTFQAGQLLPPQPPQSQYGLSSSSSSSSMLNIPSQENTSLPKNPEKGALPELKLGVFSKLVATSSVDQKFGGQTTDQLALCYSSN